MKDVHIGKLIDKFLTEKGVNRSDLARKINTTPQNVYGILKRKSIDTELLNKINKALDFNFFIHYVPNTKAEDSKELDTLKKEIEYLKEINTLLKNKK